MADNETAPLEAPKEQPKPDIGKSPKLRIDQNAPATVKIIRAAPGEGMEAPPVEVFEVQRNTLMIMTALKDHLKNDGEELTGVTIQISTKAVVTPLVKPTLLDVQEKPATIDIVLFEGTGQDVVNRLMQMCVPPEYATMALQGFIMDPLVGLTECTSLQIAMITLCFEDKGVGGFTIVNNKIPFAPGAAIMLAEAATGQIDTFKVEMMRKHNVQFPQDSKLVLPGQKGFGGPGLSRIHKPR